MSPSHQAAVDASRASPIRLLVWLALAFGIVYLVFAGGGFPGIYDVGLRVLSTAIVAVTLIGWLVFAWLRPSWQPATAIWPAFVVSLAAIGLATLVSPTARLGLDYVAYSILLTGCYLLLVRIWADPFLRPRLGALTVAAALGLCVTYLVVVFARWIDFWTAVGAIVTPPLRPAFEGLTYGNPSAVLTIAVLLAAAAIAYLGFDSARRRATVAMMLVLVLAVILATGSRAGWLAVVIGLGLTSAAWLLVSDHRAHLRRRLASQTTKAATGLVAVGAVAILAVMGPVILRRLGAGGEEGRATFFAAAIRMFEASPVSGVGPGGWAAGRIAFTPTGGVDYYVPHAHNIYLQTAAELGLLGIIAGLIAIGTLLWLVVGALRDRDPVRRRFGWASLFAVAYFGAHQLLDFYPNMPAALFAFVLPIAWLDGTADRSISARLLPKAPAAARVGRLALVVGVILSVAVLGWSESIALRATAGVDAADRSDWDSALAGARDAARADPGMPSYQFTLGLAAAATGDLKEAASALEMATIADKLPEAWLDLAAVRLRGGDESGARAALAKAMRLGDQQVANDVAAAWLYLQMKDPAAASESLLQAIVREPSLAGDPFWAGDPDIAGIWSDVLARSIAGAEPTSAWEIALVSGDPDSARAITGRLPDDERGLANLVIAGWGGNRSALTALEARAQDRPLDLVTVAWVARVASRQGESDIVQRYRRWAETVDNHSGTSAAEMRTVMVRNAGDVIAGSNTAYHSSYVYRRPAPIDHLVPWLPRLTYR